MEKIILSEENYENKDTEIAQYIPESIDEWVVIVKDPSDWEEIHNYIINENEIDSIPNKKIECINEQVYSLRTSIYLMSLEEVEILRNHPKIEAVQLNPEKYPQPQSLHIARWGTSVAFHKPKLPAARDNPPVNYLNGVRSNWSMLFVNDPGSEPFKGVGITSTSYYPTDLQYSFSGKNVDAVILDSGVAFLHPEFLKPDGTSRVKDVILDGPYKVDQEYFDNNGLTYTKIVDGVNLGVGIATAAALNWWSNSAARSARFSALGTVSIDSRYDVPHVATKTSNSNNDQLVDGHGTACASQIGGKSFGLAFECNLWNIRIQLGEVGGYLDPFVGLSACTIFHNAKKISQNGDPDPTITNNSYGITSSTGNSNGISYTHNYRGTTLNYTGNGNSFIPPANSGACRNHKFFSFNNNGTNLVTSYSGSGEYIPTMFGSTTNTAAENAIASGVIVCASAGNSNQKLSNETDVDFDNWYLYSTNYINRVAGIQKGFSGSHVREAGTIRVGALDCAVEPADSKQGQTPYSVRKVCYSNNGPMITVWAPGEMTMAAGYYGSYEQYQRQDNSNFYDMFFNGTSAACPNAVSLICLYLESNRSASQSDVINWLDTTGTREIGLSDPYGIDEPEYWSQEYNSLFDSSDKIGDSYNYRGNGNLRDATTKVIFNPYVPAAEPRGPQPFAIGNGLSFRGFTLKVS